VLKTGFNYANVGEEILNEVEDRYRRRKFLIISGVPECQTGKPDGRVAKDLEIVSQLMSEIGVHNLGSMEFSRIGRSVREKPRLVRYKCASEGETAIILRNSKNLRGIDEFSKVFINPDLTMFRGFETRSFGRSSNARNWQARRFVSIVDEPSIWITFKIFSEILTVHNLGSKSLPH